MSVSSITIREATLEDLDVLVACHVAYGREGEGTELDEDRLGKGIEGVLHSRDRGFFLMAEVDGRTVGEMQVRYEWSTWRNATFWWLENVYVLPEWRRRGIFTAMHRYVYNEARRRDEVCGIRLYAAAENQGARQTYRSLGMTGHLCEFFEQDFVLGGH